MKKIFLLIPFALFAFNIDFSNCYKKFAFVRYSIPVTPTRSVSFYRPQKYLFYDPFTKIYVFYHKNKKTVKFFSSPRLGWWMAGIRQNAVYGGTYAKKACLLNMAALSVKVPKNSIVSDLFCRAYGVGNGNFIPSSYLRHFVKYGYWGDIGIEVDENMVVKSVDPFVAKGIKPGDKIIRINMKKADIGTFTKYVILAQKGKGVALKTNRGEYLLSVRKKRYAFTPLSYYGIEVDKSLSVTKMPKKLQNRFFKHKKIKIYAVNFKRVYSYEGLKKALSYDKNVTITFIQDGIKINITLRR